MVPMIAPPPFPHLRRRAAVAVAALAACSGCAGPTIYRPTEPRPAMGPGVQVDILSMRAQPPEAEVSIRVRQPTVIGPVTWASGDRDSCSTPGGLLVARQSAKANFEPQPETFEIGADTTVLVQLGAANELDHPGLFLDFKVDTHAEQGCLRTPLTAAGGETLWRSDRKPSLLSAGLRVDAPLGALEGTGTRFAVVARGLRHVGPVRLFLGVSFGAAGCRGADCPPTVFADGSGEATSGLFGHVGVEAGLERHVPLGRWSLSLALGGAISSFHLNAPTTYAGERDAGVGGPFAAVGLISPPRGTIPGFAPPAGGYAHGPEVTVQRAIAFGRGPTESAWVVGFGWRLEGPD
jgi:hypothetical protein